MTLQLPPSNLLRATGYSLAPSSTNPESNGTDSDKTNYHIEQASWRDLNALRRLEQECFLRDAWPLLDLIGVLAFPNVVRLKAVLDEEMIGFVAGDVRSSQGLAWISTIAVFPRFRGRGIGRALLEACEGRLEVSRIQLSVRISNQAAIRLYEDAGYHREGLWSGYYEDGEDALVMQKER